MIDPNDYVLNYGKFLKDNPESTSMDRRSALFKLLCHARDHYLKEGEKNALNNDDYIKKPELEEEQLAYLLRKCPELAELINIFELELEV